MPDKADDRSFMAAAIRVARRHLGQTSTNPSVGCVIVQQGRIVAEAVTAIGGRPHAERQALALAGEKARGATAYVTLEPCSHHGKTPPCADALIAAGIARVVVAVDDPDPRVSGRGYAMLRQAGIAVETGLLAGQARRDLAPYLMRHIQGRAHVTVKLAVSADGMIGKIGAGQVAITGPISRSQVQMLRAETDAILVGIGTARVDDPALTVRLKGAEQRSPLRIVLDRRFELPLTSHLARTAGQVATLCVSCCHDTSENDGTMRLRREALSALGVETLILPDLSALLAHLAGRGLSSLLVEGGAAVVRSFLEAGLVDRIQLYEGQTVIGAQGVASALTRANIPQTFKLFRQARFGADLFFEYERDF
ncbi:bifunctional diaminohydroxyphosphoribosylaminopyrimidine deaminase/5-amino-6-(5-phosphoribosylamino)uracil reductase RibD [Allorhizobium undicola]|uniref:bifunctional diaminohydroxyphosphoribosylaminopyrimidine deaminase/5-amino-6-(5-phosphoribosylamino)uracil reductase RibD n=1 Tax=Allorhizobium undicola TaxID=78527 RepID=UPI003D328D23